MVADSWKEKTFSASHNYDIGVIFVRLPMRRRTRFRPCIDLHDGKVKQIVGGSLDSSSEELKTNFTTDLDPSWFAGKYAEDELTGGHVIKLGPGNDEAARSALRAYPNGMQLGGGITAGNASTWLSAGASHVIATSFLFDSGAHFREERLAALLAETGRERLVIDLSCRQDENGWVVAMNRWQTITDLHLTHETLDQLASSCDEFLIHAADVEGKCEGIDEALVELLGQWGKLPVTYAGGASCLEDLKRVDDISGGLVDLTIGSALDIFGGDGVSYSDCVVFNRLSDSR
jgi:phosphoribosylformimino-5-aminoimidazole carboxamide ribotide isomerase